MRRGRQGQYARWHRCGSAQGDRRGGRPTTVVRLGPDPAALAPADQRLDQGTRRRSADRGGILTRSVDGPMRRPGQRAAIGVGFQCGVLLI